jgi:hypothetical protein
MKRRPLAALAFGEGSRRRLSQIAKLNQSASAYSGRCGHLILFDVGSDSVLMWAAFFVLP